MAGLNYITPDKSDPKGKPRVYFACHPEDFSPWFLKLCSDIFKTHDCVIYYTDQLVPEEDGVNHSLGLESMNLFVFPVTKNLLTAPCRAIAEELPLARKKRIPILPIMLEPGLNELYARPEYFGELQYLTPGSGDATEIAYTDKLKRYLDSVLISNEIAARVRSAFDAYIFLSYRKKDRRYANELMRLIHSSPLCRDIAIWFDEFLTPGESFKVNIDKVLADSKLFALLVTPNLLEEPNGKPNFVMGEEYPAACRNGKAILPAEMVCTDRTLLDEKFSGIPEALNMQDPLAREQLQNVIGQYARQKNVRGPGHNFLIGLAYLGGIDMEINRTLALELITGAAKAGLPEAMEKLILMYTDGDGVDRDRDKVLFWSRALAENYFGRVFDSQNHLQDTQALAQLFDRYKNPYYAGVIRAFLLAADARVDTATAARLYRWLTRRGIREYTLLLETCREMVTHRTLAEELLVEDILTRSVTGEYPPYGPLFWYIPEYDLYHRLLPVAAGITEPLHLARALALIRDVCFIFGQQDSADCATVDIPALYRAAEGCLTGVRKALCRLFYLGEAAPACLGGIYPRCFDVTEATSLYENGYGIFGRNTMPFADELSLFSQEMFSQLDGEYIGLVACPYDRDAAGKKLQQKPCEKLRGLLLSPTEDICMDYIPFHRAAVRALYIPENCVEATADFKLHMNLQLGVACSREGVVYFRDRVALTGIDRIPAGMFRDCNMLTGITLPETVTHIEKEAFLNCSGLVDIHLPEGLRELGVMAFEGCEALPGINIPQSLTAIPPCAFYHCRSLAGLQLHAGIREIGAEAFTGCHSLTKLALPKGITYLGYDTFAGCGFTEVTVPEGVTEIGPCCFSGCSKLTRLTLPAGITQIGDQAFSGCGKLTKLHLKEGLKRIGEWAFYGCEGLTEVLLPEGLAEIGKSAFFHCFGLRSLVIPDSVMTIGHMCFYQNRLESVTLPGRFSDGEWLTHTRLHDAQNIQFTGELPPRTDPQEDFWAEESPETPPVPVEKKVVIPEGTTHIPERAFSEDPELVEVIIPDSVIEIGKEAFYECRNLRTARLPANLQTVGDSAFSICPKLTDLALPPSLTQIGKAAFHFTGITALTLHPDMTVIPARAFARCHGLTALRIPNGVQVIDRAAFSNCSNLREICLPDRLRVIGDSAFDRCPITEIRLPDTLVEIGCDAFSRCENLTSIHFPPTVTTIGHEAFALCHGLTDVEIPPTVRHIGDDAFVACQNLKRVRLSANFKNDVERIFSDCPLESVYFI